MTKTILQIGPEEEAATGEATEGEEEVTIIRMNTTITNRRSRSRRKLW